MQNRQSKFQTQIDIPKYKKIKKLSKKIQTCTKISATNIDRQAKIRRNFKIILDKLMNSNDRNATNCLISYLTLYMPNQKPEQSKYNITSIQNLISEQHINLEPEVDEDSSWTLGQIMSSKLIDQHQDITTLYLCLLEKITKCLKCQTNPSQNKKIIKGTWNILLKYWKDCGYRYYSNVGNQVEWGLMELIDFDFRATVRERYDVDQRLVRFEE